MSPADLGAEWAKLAVQPQIKRVCLGPNSNSVVSRRNILGAHPFSATHICAVN